MPARRPNFVLLALLAIVLIWVVGALFDTVAYDIGPVSATLGARLSTHEWYFRLLMIGTVALFGALAEWSTRRVARAEADQRQMLERSRQEWRDAFDGVRDPIFMHDHEFRITRTNRAYQQLAALPGELLSGHPYWEIFPRGEGPLPGCRRALDHGGEEHEEVRLADGRTFVSRAFAVHDEGGRYRYSVHILEDVTTQRRAEQALRRSEERFRLVVAGSPVAVFTCDRNMRYTWIYNAPPAFPPERIIGHTEEEFLAPEDAAQLLAMKRYVLEHGRGIRQEQEVVVEGRTIVYDMSMDPLRDEGGDVIGIAGTAMDVTGQHEAEEFQRLALTVFNTMGEGIVIADPALRTQHVNPAFTRITGFSAEEMEGRDFFALGAGPHGTDYYEEMRQALDRVGHWEGEVWSRRRNGSIYPQWLSIVALRSARRVEHYVAVFLDDTRRKEQEEVIRRQANYDPLTGLPNRILFLDRLTAAISKAKRNRRILALLYIDLDRFKWVNDTLGHDAGDELLREAARRIGSSVRESDTVARIGGDEFTVILPEIANADDAELVARTILRELARPYLLGGTQAYIGGSIGITEFPSDAQNAAGLLKNADTAMYRAKEEGRNTFRFFTPEMNARAVERMSLESALRHALEHEELRVFYQPVVDLRQQRVTGAEALLRWEHPVRGLVAPSEFIGLSEETGLIEAIGAWVLRKVCAQLESWNAAGLDNLRVSVNLSARQCLDYAGAAAVRRIVEECGIPPEWLTLEVTESVIFADLQRAAETLNDFRRLGLHLALDDFGTGYSSLSYLKRLPFDALKIDTSFVTDLPGDSDDATLVEAILAMAHGLHLGVVAEGAETREQLQFLQERGCDFVQGAYYSCPLPPEEFEHYVRTFPERTLH